MGMAARMAAAAVVGEGVDVRLSEIPGAGNGLFVDRPFVRNELITEYYGHLIGRETAEKLRAQGLHTHVRCLNMQHAYLDGLRQPVQGVGGGSFANDARDAERNNAAFVTIYDHHTGCDRVFLKALKPIAAGREVFVSYGKVYWEVHGLAASPRTRRVAAALEVKARSVSARAKAYERAAAVARRSRSVGPSTPEPMSSGSGTPGRSGSSSSSCCSMNHNGARGYASQREVSPAAAGGGRAMRARAVKTTAGVAAPASPVTPSKGRRLQEEGPEAPATAPRDAPALKRSKSTPQPPGGSATAARAAARAAAVAERAAAAAAAAGAGAGGRAARGLRAAAGPLTPSKSPRRPSAAVEEERSPKRSKSVSPPHTHDAEPPGSRRATRVAPASGRPGASALTRRLFPVVGAGRVAVDAGSRQPTPAAMQPATPSARQPRLPPAAVFSSSSRQLRGRRQEQQLPLVAEAATARKPAARIAITRLVAVPMRGGNGSRGQRSKQQQDAAAACKPAARIAITRLVAVPVGGGNGSRGLVAQQPEQQLADAAAACKPAARIAITRLVAVPVGGGNGSRGQRAQQHVEPPQPPSEAGTQRAGQQQQQQPNGKQERPGSAAAADTRATRDQVGSKTGQQQGRVGPGKAPNAAGAAVGGRTRSKAPAAAPAAAAGATRTPARNTARGNAAGGRTPPPDPAAAAAGGSGGVSPRQLGAVLARWSPTKGSLVAAAQAMGSAAAALFKGRPSPSSAGRAPPAAGGRRGAAAAGTPAGPAGRRAGTVASVNKMRPWL